MREIVTNQGMILVLPAGYRFMPTEEELINFYLKRKDMGLPLPPHCVIERDVYGDLAPWDLFNDDQDPWEMLEIRDEHSRKVIKNERVIYVFTRLKKITDNRIRRTAGCGTWDAQNRVELKNRKKEVIGFKKLLVYRANKGSTLKNNNAEAYGHWIMHEFSLGDEVAQSDYVLCRIKRDGSKCLKEGHKIQNNLEQHITSSVTPQVEYPGHAKNLSKRTSESEDENPQRKKMCYSKTDRTKTKEVSSVQALLIAKPVTSLHQPVPAIEVQSSQKPWDDIEVCATEMIDEYLLKNQEESNCLILSSRPESDDGMTNGDMDLFDFISQFRGVGAEAIAPAEVLSQNMFYDNAQDFRTSESIPSLHQVPTSSSNRTVAAKAMGRY